MHLPLHAMSQGRHTLKLMYEQLMTQSLGQPLLDTTFVIIDEVETDNWGVGGTAVTTLRKRAAEQKTS